MDRPYAPQVGHGEFVTGWAPVPALGRAGPAAAPALADHAADLVAVVGGMKDELH